MMKHLNITQAKVVLRNLITIQSKKLPQEKLYFIYKPIPVDTIPATK